MVKYYGRARQRIGSVNTNQIGLKMSGCPSKVGRKGTIDRYISRRSQCNQKYCGPVYYHGVIWNWNAGQCVAKAPRGQSFNSGVGTKVGNPRFACNKTCSTGNGGGPWWYNNPEVLAAVNLLKSYFGSLGLNFVLVGESETLASDVVPALPAGETIDHYEKGRPLYDTLPLIYQRAADLINSINFQFAVILDSGTVSMRHIVGAVTPQVAATLKADATPYGIPISFSSNVEVTAYGSTPFCGPPTGFDTTTGAAKGGCTGFLCLTPCKYTRLTGSDLGPSQSFPPGTTSADIYPSKNALQPSFTATYVCESGNCAEGSSCSAICDPSKQSCKDKGGGSPYFAYDGNGTKNWYNVYSDGISWWKI